MYIKKRNEILIIILSSVIVILLAIFIFIALSGNKTNLSRTIMIYMVGSDLESGNGLATVDLNEINYNLMDNQNINVLLVAGGTKKWQNDYIETNETSIYKLTPSGFSKIREQNLQNMGSSEVLSNFINYVYNNYKTDKYDLIFWNHGGAINGSEFDEISKDNLSLVEMKEALKNTPFNQNNKIETIMFRTCLNGTIEVADIFTDYSDYLVASEEVTNGYRLEGMLKFINTIKTSDTGYDVSKKFIDSYKNMMRNLNNTLYSLGVDETYIYSTYSIVDLSKIKKLENSINDFFSSIDLSKNYNEIGRVRSNLYQYASDENAYDMVDLYNLVYELKSLNPSKADNVLKNIENTVLYNWATNSKSRGISIYFPFNGKKQEISYFLDIYKDFNSLNEYNKFINNFNYLKNSNVTSYSYLENKTTVDNKEKQADFTLELTDEQLKTFAKASFIVFKNTHDDYYYPVYRGNNLQLNGNKLQANIKDRQLKAVSTLDGTENIVTLIEDEYTDDYIKYTALLTLEDFSSEDIFEWKYDAVKMSLVYDKLTGNTKIGSVIINNGDNDLPGIVAVNLDDYTNMVFASSSYKILDDNGNYTSDWVSDGGIKGMEEKVDKVDFKLQNFDDGYDYYCVFYIFDTNNNVSYSKLVKLN